MRSPEQGPGLRSRWSDGGRRAVRALRHGTLMRDAGVYLAGFIVVALVRFLAIPFFTRSLGTVGYSDLALVLATTTGLAAIIGLGGDVALSRFWFRQQTEQDRRDLTLTWIVFLLLWSVVMISSLVAVLFAFDLLAEQPQLRSAMVLGLAGMVPAQAGRMLAQVLRNQFQPVKYSLLTAGTVGVGVALGMVAVLGLGMGVGGAVLGVLLAEVCGAGMALVLVRRELAGSLRPALLPGLLRFGAPIAPAALASWVFVGADRIVVERVLGDGALGPYSVATSLVLPISMLMYAMGQAWLPRVSALYERDPDAGASLTSRGLEVSLYLYGQIAVALGLVAPWLVVVVAGEAFAAGATPLPLLAVGSALWGTTMFTSTGYVLARRTGIATLVPICAAGLTVGMLVVLTPRLGTVGAAAAVATGYLLLTSGLLAVSLCYVKIPVPWPRLGIALMVLSGNATVGTLVPATAVALASAVSAAAVLGSLLIVGHRNRARR